MKSPEDLFHLIKSMSRSEKRYFKVSSAQNAFKEEKNYIKIFNSIDKQQVYNKDKLLKLFIEEKTINALHAAKSYLYYLILRSLRNFHAGKSTDREIHELLDYVELLFEKQLYKQCIKVLKRASEIALKTEQFLHLLKINNWHYKILREMQDVEDLKELLNTLPAQEQQLMKQYMNCREYEWNICEMQITYAETGVPRNKNEARVIEAVMRKILRVKNTPLSARANFFSAYIPYFNAFISSNYKQMYHYAKQIVHLLEAFPDFEKEYAKIYILMLDNMIHAASRIKKYDAILACVEKIRSLKATSEHIKEMIFLHSYYAELRYYFATGKFREGILLAQELESKIATIHYTKINKLTLQNIYQSFIYLYMGAMEYSTALKYVNKFINKELNVKYNTDCEIHIANLIIHYELGNTDLLEYLLKSTHRFLYKRRRLLKFEAYILVFIKNVIHSGNVAHKITEAFIDLKEKLVTLSESEDPFEKAKYELFDYISWLESKIENRNFADVIREKAISEGEKQV